MDNRFATLVNDLRQRIEAAESGRANFIKHFIASLLYGAVKVRMYKEQNHQRPHVHVYYEKDHSASVAIDNGEFLASDMPAKPSRAIKEWVLANQKYLQSQWQNLQEGKAPIEYESVF